VVYFRVNPLARGFVHAGVLQSIYNEINNFVFQGIKMKYKVHVFKISGGNDVYELERFLNNLDGEVISIIPKIKRMSLPQIYGMSSRVDYLLIVEKLASAG
jgi:hypothetical protein